MYFDTLKVSTVEQTAEQTSARGGLGNPELITWDYGKEITVTLEDALFTPAQQSLMWGGKFGVKNTKIYGVWNPYIYEKDENGKTIWGKRLIAYPSDYNEEPDDNGVYWPAEENTNYLVIGERGEYYRVYKTEGSWKYEELEDAIDQRYNSISTFNPPEIGWRQFICPCDMHIKYMLYIEAPTSHYKYHWTTPTEDQFNGFGLKCPKGLEIKENDKPLIGYSINEVYGANSHPWENNERPEFAELTIKNFGNFNFEKYTYSPDETGEYCISTLGTDGLNERCICSDSYVWEDSDLIMTSLEGNQDIYSIDNVDVRIRVPQDSTDKQIMIAPRQLYKTLYNSTTGKWEFESEDNEPVLGNTNLAERYNTSGLSYAYKKEPYGSKLDVYTSIPWTVPSLTQGAELNYTTRILVGTFYIIDEWNSFASSPYEMIYPINDGMEDVQVLERMEKCKAPQTFAIDARANLASFNYAQLPQYSSAALTYYIDPKTMKPFEPNATEFRRANGQIVQGDLRIIKQYQPYYKWTRTIAPKYTTLGHTIIVDAIHYPGTYRLVGETYVRDRDTGKDHRYQFEIPLAKMGSENNLTLQADGDPTTFTMTLKALRRDDGVMMKLTQYNVECENYDGYASGSTKPVPDDGKGANVWEDFKTEYQKEIQLLEPNGRTFAVSAGANTREINTVAVLNTSTRSVNSTFNFNTASYTQEISNWEQSNSRVLDKDEYTIEIEDITDNGEGE